jgi:transcriptional regulator with XRE-family HTH domain
MVVQPTSFAERLRTLREAAGMSQYSLAKRSGLSKQALSNLELGRREPNWITVQRIAAALGVDCTEFNDPTVLLPPVDEPSRKAGRPKKETPGEPKPKRSPGQPRKGK